MKKLLLSVVFLGLLAADTRADLMLFTSNPPGSPLTMSAGTTSAPMFVSVVSDNPPSDVMAAWNVSLKILPDAGATGTLTFQDPATGTPPNPPNYVFDGNGLGVVATSGGNLLSANDFYDPGVGPGAPVPGSPGANLLQMDFLASSNASGLFEIYALEGAALTQWTDSNATTQFFTDVPDGTGMVRIGEVLIATPQSVPEPSSLSVSLSLLSLAAGAIAIHWRRCKQR
jgi:hypothetical protein